MLLGFAGAAVWDVGRQDQEGNVHPAGWLSAVFEWPENIDRKIPAEIRERINGKEGLHLWNQILKTKAQDTSTCLVTSESGKKRRDFQPRVLIGWLFFQSIKQLSLFPSPRSVKCVSWLIFVVIPKLLPPQCTLFWLPQGLANRFSWQRRREGIFMIDMRANLWQCSELCRDSFLWNWIWIFL